jgi:O-antigen/teichoic acid export membrane protein
MNSFGHIVFIPLNFWGSALLYRMSFISGKYGAHATEIFRTQILRASAMIGLTSGIIWIGLTPLFKVIFHLDSYWPLIFFAPIWPLSFLHNNDRNYLSGTFGFKAVGIIIIVEIVAKIAALLVIIFVGATHLFYTVLTVAAIAQYIIGRYVAALASREHRTQPLLAADSKATAFPLGYAVSNLFSTTSLTAFLSFDILVAKHLFAEEQVGIYSIMAIFGKIIFFLGSIITQFVPPLVAHAEGRRGESRGFLHISLASTIIFCLCVFIACVPFGEIFVELLIGGQKYQLIAPYLAIYLVGMICFTISRTFEVYYSTKKVYSFAGIMLLSVILQFALIIAAHESILDVVRAVAIAGSANLALYLIISARIATVKNLEQSFLTSVKRSIRRLSDE